MFIKVDKKDNLFTILDTEDMSEEQITSEEAEQYIYDLGIKIYGLCGYTALNVTTYLRIGNYDYDGKLCYNASQIQEDDYSVQYITAKDFGENKSEEHIRVVYDAIRRSNGYDLITEVKPFGYKYINCNDETLFATELATGNVVEFDIFAVAFSYFNEGLSIEGIDSFDGVTLKVADKELSAYKFLYNILNHRQSSGVVSQSDTFIGSVPLYSEIKYTWSQIGSVFVEEPLILHKDCYYPFYNPNNSLVYHRGNYNGRIPYFDKIVAINGGEVIFSNGEVVTDIETLMRCNKILDFEDESLRDTLNKLFESHIGKSIFMLDKTKGYFDDLLKNYSKVYSDEGYTSYELSLYVEEEKEKYAKINFLAAKFKNYGKFILEPTENANSSDPLFASRFKHLGFIHAYPALRTVSFGKDADSATTLCNERFTTLMKHLVSSGYTYHDDFILPLFSHKIDIEDDIFNIRVICLTNSLRLETERKDKVEVGSKEWGTYGLHFLDLPLIALGNLVKKYDDCYVFRLLYENVIISNELINYTYAEMLNHYPSIIIKKDYTTSRYDKMTGILNKNTIGCLKEIAENLS